MHDGTIPAPGSGEDPAQDRPGAADESSPDADATRPEEPGDDVNPPKPARKTMSERDRQRLAAIFGDVLPDTTSDERDPGTASRDNDAWYRENRPPHHDR